MKQICISETCRGKTKVQHCWHFPQQILAALLRREQSGELKRMRTTSWCRCWNMCDGTCFWKHSRVPTWYDPICVQTANSKRTEDITDCGNDTYVSQEANLALWLFFNFVSPTAGRVRQASCFGHHSLPCFTSSINCIAASLILLREIENVSQLDSMNGLVEVPPPGETHSTIQRS